MQADRIRVLQGCMEGYDREGLHRPERNQSLDGGSESCLRFSESQKESRSMRRAAFLDDAACRKTTRSRGIPLVSPWGQNLALNRALGLTASHTLSAKFPCMCPVHPHMSAGRDFFDSLLDDGCIVFLERRRRAKGGRIIRGLSSDGASGQTWGRCGPRSRCGRCRAVRSLSYPRR